MSSQPQPVTIVATVRNERDSIRAFVESLLAQTHRPDELIIVDGESTDGTLEALREYERAGKLRVISRACNIAEGRNLGIAAARNELIAVTDAGCRADPDWLRNLVTAFAAPESPDVVAGNYAFDTSSAFEEASVLATNAPDRETGESAKYYPSSRSIAFRRAAWVAAKGYPEWLYAAEDTLFNIRLRHLGFRFHFCRDAIVRWRPRPTWKGLARQHFNYARGNGRIGLGLTGYWTNLQYHGGFVLLALAALLWWPAALVALGLLIQHVQRNLWRQARFAEQASGSKAMFWRVLGVMEAVRIAGLAGFLAGRWDRLRDPAFVRAQREWMGVETVEQRPRLPAWTTVALLLGIPAQALAIVSLWGISAAGPAVAVVLLLCLKSLKDFSRTGPRLKDEILAHYVWYSLYAMARLTIWALAVCLMAAGAGLLVYEGLVALAALPRSAMLEWGAALSGIGVVSGLQFCRHLLHIPGSIAASSNYRLSRFYPLWRVLSPPLISATTGALALFGLACGALAIRAAQLAGAEGHAILLGATTLLNALIVLAASWAPEPRARQAAPRPAGDRPNLLMIGADTLRADRLGAEGYHRPLTPAIDGLAARSAYFAQCYVPCARTAPSLASMLTGAWPKHHGIRENFSLPADARPDAPSLPALLRQAGYRTLAVSDWAGADLGKYPFGFEHRDLPEDQWNIKYLIRQGPKDIRLFLSLFTHNRFGKRFLPELYYLAGIPMTDELGRAARGLISDCAASTQPFVMNVFLSTTHAPFASEYPYYAMFADRRYAGDSKFVMGLLNDPFEIIKRQGHTEKEFDLPQILALYDGCVKRFDDEVGRILGHLRACGLDGNTVVLVYSDHGIEFFERDTWGQGNSVVVDKSARVPIVLHDPRAPSARRIGEVTRTVDLAPTLLDLLGLPVPAEMDGVSLAPHLRGREPCPGLLAYGETGIWFTRLPGMPEDHLSYPALPDLLAIPDKSAGTLAVKEEFQRLVLDARDTMVRDGRWKLVRIPLAGGAERVMLFDVVADPDCRRDVSAAEPATRERLRAALQAWRDDGDDRWRPAQAGAAPATAGAGLGAAEAVQP